MRGGPVLAPIAAGLAIFVMLGTLTEIVGARLAARRVAVGGACPARAACRCRSGAARSPISAPASRCSASLRPASAPRRSRRCGSARRRRSAPIRSRRQFGRRARRPQLSRDRRDDDDPLRTASSSRRSSRRAGSSRRGRWRRRRPASPRLRFGQVYVSIGDPDADGTVPARLYWKPLVTLIWLGACVMALGGALSLADRRLRFGAPARAQSAAAAAARGRADDGQALRAAPRSSASCWPPPPPARCSPTKS